MLIRRETPADVGAIRAVHASAFGDPRQPARIPAEVGLVDALRASDAWLPELSLVAEGDDRSLHGHVVCSRGWVDGVPALGLGPLGVRADLHRHGIGSALMHTVLGAGDVHGEPLVALLGDPGYYRRFGFRPGHEYGVTPPVAEWAPNFQVRTLTTYTPTLRGPFRYAQPFAGVWSTAAPGRRSPMLVAHGSGLPPGVCAGQRAAGADRSGIGGCVTGS
jgi:putative acetyltransferase